LLERHVCDAVNEPISAVLRRENASAILGLKDELVIVVQALAEAAPYPRTALQLDLGVAMRPGTGFFELCRQRQQRALRPLELSR
jgi:hypothetical protein